MAKVLVVADIKNGSLGSSTTELLSKAKAIGAEAAVVAIGSGIESLTANLAGAGSATQYIADDPSLAMFSAGPYAACVVDAANQFGADMIWFGFSESGKPPPRVWPPNWMSPVQRTSPMSFSMAIRSKSSARPSPTRSSSA
ncbi:hypothetical protein [Desulfosarcina cetonica]|uniref:hypothetical protein n=1 Tax=Desulfosarcina cetonica TaxID=90730 RepID=UPI00248AFED5|nr:hypothetical protein [Desulfosarcina cetonica]